MNIDWIMSFRVTTRAAALLPWDLCNPAARNTEEGRQRRACRGRKGRGHSAHSFTMEETEKKKERPPPPIDHFLTVMEDREREREAESPAAKRRSGREDYD